jgi:hypothetical protein
VRLRILVNDTRVVVENASAIRLEAEGVTHSMFQLQTCSGTGLWSVLLLRLHTARRVAIHVPEEAILHHAPEVAIATDGAKLYKGGLLARLWRRRRNVLVSFERALKKRNTTTFCSRNELTWRIRFLV